LICSRRDARALEKRIDHLTRDELQAAEDALFLMLPGLP
jgi:hypothetical protein